MSEYDLVVIGGGPGGYVGAIRAAQLGMKVAVVERRDEAKLGGTCLNEGCIPSKALLNDSELFEELNHEGAKRGIKGTFELDLKAMMKRKSEAVSQLVSGIDMLFNKNKITKYQGHGIVMGKGEVAVKPVGKKGSPESLKTKNILIATGSEVMPLAGVEVDQKQIVDSTGALELDKVPNKLVVIGGGVIGLELGSVWRRLGAEVTVIEYLDKILPPMDNEVSKEFQKILTKQGIEFKLSSKVTGAKTSKSGVELTVEPASGGDAETLNADVVLVSIGRRPYTENLGLNEAGVKLNDRGRIEVDSRFQTNVEGIYAVGDVIEGPMLAHKAEEDGVCAAEIMAGQKPHFDYNLVASVVYTDPEVATVGQTEEQLKQAGRAYNKGKFPFLGNSRAKTIDHTDGFVKILADKETDEVLGVHIIGHQAGTMIMEAVTVMEFKGSAEDIARTCHTHPDLHEAIKEAAMDVAKRAIHK